MAIATVPNFKDNEYYTPKEFVDRFGKFDYDPATTKLGKKGKSPAFGSVVMKLQDTWEIEMISIK